jgi:hypothetical protein
MRWKVFPHRHLDIIWTLSGHHLDITWASSQTHTPASSTTLCFDDEDMIVCVCASIEALEHWRLRGREHGPHSLELAYCPSVEQCRVAWAWPSATETMALRPPGCGSTLVVTPDM